jgi:hypothetical protein
VLVGQVENAGIEREGMWQQELVHEPRHALRRFLGYLVWQPFVGMFDAMPDDAQAGKNTIVFPDMRRELSVDGSERHQFEVPLL